MRQNMRNPLTSATNDTIKFMKRTIKYSLRKRTVTVRKTFRIMVPVEAALSLRTPWKMGIFFTEYTFSPKCSFGCYTCLCSENRVRGIVVLKALSYMPEGRGFEIRWGEWISCSIYIILPVALGPGVYSASNRNKYQRKKCIYLGSTARLVRRANNLAAMCEPII
jgi:hypothetical protein